MNGALTPYDCSPSPAHITISPRTIGNELITSHASSVAGGVGSSSASRAADAPPTSSVVVVVFPLSPVTITVSDASSSIVIVSSPSIIIHRATAGSSPSESSSYADVPSISRSVPRFPAHARPRGRFFIGCRRPSRARVPPPSRARAPSRATRGAETFSPVEFAPFRASSSIARVARARR